MMKSEIFKIAAVVALVSVLIGGNAVAGWAIYAPYDGEYFEANDTIWADGEGDPDSDYRIKVIVNGAVKFDDSGVTDGEGGNWDMECKPLPGGWTNSVVIVNGTLQLYKGTVDFKDAAELLEFSAYL